MLRLYNTLTRRKEALKPLKKGRIGLYTCGPTVYDFAHIGNFRAYIAADLLRRYLEYKGLKVRHIMNITDVDDKTINRSGEKGMGLSEFTRLYTKYFFEDIEKLNILKAQEYPRATGHIKEMGALINRLFKKGIAYKGKDGSIYYKISRFPGYGKLSHTSLKGLKSGARVCQDEYEKGEARDFALWKAWSKGDGKNAWTLELGGEKIRGRPGWHIECSAMSMKYLGESLDIHSGGVDLIFPHHENEIAQSEGATGKQFARHWFHNEHLLVNSRKMSKSLGNFHTLRDLLKKGHDPRAIRYILLATHYRQQLNFTEKALAQARETIKGLEELAAKLRGVRGGASPKGTSAIERGRKGFEKAMDDDLNIAGALASVFNMARELNVRISGKGIGEKEAREALGVLEGIDQVLGLGLSGAGAWHSIKEAPPGIRKMIEKREALRKEKKWKESDRIRAGLRKKGITLEDTGEGAKWKKA